MGYLVTEEFYQQLPPIKLIKSCTALYLINASMHLNSSTKSRVHTKKKNLALLCLTNALLGQKKNCNTPFLNYINLSMHSAFSSREYTQKNSAMGYLCKGIQLCMTNLKTG